MLGKNIKLLREKLGLTQEELAQKMGMHCNTIARWERDEVDPRGTSLWKLAKALNVSSATLLTGEVNIPETEINSGMNMGGTHGMSFSVPLDEDINTSQATNEEIQNRLIVEERLNPNHLERYNGRTFYAGRSGHLYSPAPFRGISFWGEVLDAADFTAEKADERELARIEPLLRDAYETILNALRNKKKRKITNSEDISAQHVDIHQTNIGRDATVNVGTNTTGTSA